MNIFLLKIKYRFLQWLYLLLYIITLIIAGIVYLIFFLLFYTIGAIVWKDKTLNRMYDHFWKYLPKIEKK